MCVFVVVCIIIVLQFKELQMFKMPLISCGHNPWYSCVIAKFRYEINIEKGFLGNTKWVGESNVVVLNFSQVRKYNFPWEDKCLTIQIWNMY